MIAIKGMEELPKNCAECNLVTDDLFGGAICVLLCDEWKDNENHRAENCPLVEIITCKNCKHRIGCKCESLNLIVADDGYCANAERKE